MLFLIERDNDDVRYNEFCGFVISAETEDAARATAAQHAGSKGKAPWATCSCRRIQDDWPRGVVLESFIAG